MPRKLRPWNVPRAIIVALALVCGAFLTTSQLARAQSPPDVATGSGWFFTQTAPGEGLGFEVTDAEDIPFWTFFQSAGGVRRLGYPISNRWSNGPLTYQAFQKSVLTWSASDGVAFVNVYDALSHAGRDHWLRSARGVPFPPDAKPNDGRSSADVLTERLEILQPYPDIERRWFRNDRWLETYGLPVVSEVRDEFVVLRAQRAVFRQWRLDSEAAVDPPVIIISHSGVDYRDGGMIPSAATVAIPDPNLAGTTGVLAFLSNRDGAWNLWSMTPTGTDLTQLTLSGGLTSRPNWSLDGQRIAYSAFASGGYQVFVADSDGGNPRQLTNTTATDWEAWWAPDGERLVFASTRSGESEIYTMLADGSDQRVIGDQDGFLCYPAWSTDGSRIIFTSGAAIVTINLDDPIGTRSVIGSGRDPSFSPDGSRITFARWVGDAFDVFIANADGSNEIRLTTHPASDWNPVWSPDGAKIAFASYRDANWEVYTVRVDGTDLQRITDSPASDYLPAWGPQPN
jgi:hypothetical protein